MKLLRKLLFASIVGIFGILSACLGYYFWITRSTSLSPEKLLLPDASILLYDNASTQLSGIGNFQERAIINIKDLPSHLPAAFISTEDKRFYRHNGFDGIGIARATLRNIKSGVFKEGASTISQQLIKNTHLTLDKTISRKLKEFKLTRQLERKYSKQEILETYLNTIYFGHSCYGVADAAHFYFGKNATELSIDESAMLAGLVKSPNNYSPFKNPEKAYARRKVVLQLMNQQKIITDSQFKNALNAPLPTASVRINTRSYAHFAIQELDTILDKTDLYSSGKIEVFTYLDPLKQELLEKEKNAFSSDKTYAIINNCTHGIEGYYSTVSQIERSPGSLIKPLLVYAPAVEEGLLSVASPILDAKTDFGGYSPKNYDGSYAGYVSVREAISKSLNVPAVKALNTLTIERASAYAEKLGLPIPPEDRHLAFALGGMQHGYPFIRLINAFSCFTNNGNYTPAHFIKEVKVNGLSVYHAPTEKAKVFSPETAYLLTDCLTSAASNGTAKKLRSLPFQVAAKTGTVGNQKGNTDAYTVAYTTEHTVGIWLGNADCSPIDATGGGVPCTIAKNVFERIYQNYQPKEFKKPSGISTLQIDRYSYEKDGHLLLADPASPLLFRKTEQFITRYAPTEVSTAFSCPKAPLPCVENCESGIKISYNSLPPDIYRYKIIRQENSNKKTIYDGAAFDCFIDRKIKANTLYQYSIVAYYKNHEGEETKLPSIISKKELPIPPIADKPWWENN